MLARFSILPSRATLSAGFSPDAQMKFLGGESWRETVGSRCGRRIPGWRTFSGSGSALKASKPSMVGSIWRDSDGFRMGRP
jgi:hypothetical protein